MAPHHSPLHSNPGGRGQGTSISVVSKLVQDDQVSKVSQVSKLQIVCQKDELISLLSYKQVFDSGSDDI
eukprot:15326666-Ditylum_brightwellii.AAC.1